MPTDAKNRLFKLLRWSEKYTKTDMVYVARGGFWLNADFIVSALTSLLLAILFAHLLSKAEFGFYQYVLSIAAILSALSFTGMNPAVTQAVARGKEGVVRRSIPIQVLYNLFSSVVGIGIATYYYTQGNTAIALVMLVASLTLPLTNAANTYQAFFNGRKDFRKYFLYDAFFNVAYTVLMLGVLLVSHSGTVVAISYFLFSLVLTAGLCAHALRAEMPNDLHDPEAIHYARHLSALGILGTVAARIDSILVFHYLGPVDLAIYSFAKIIPEKLLGFAKSIGSLSFPKFSVQGNEQIGRGILRKILVTLGAASLAALTYAVAAPFIFSWLFPGYQDSVRYSQAIALILLSAAAYLPVSALVAQKRTRDLYVLNTMYPIIQIALLYFLLVTLGLWGIILARILSAILYPLFSLYVFLLPVKRGGAV